MRAILNNMGYFIKEAKTMIRINFISNLLSILSIGLIIFFAVMVLSGWWLSNEIVEALKSEAEINIFLRENVNKNDIDNLINSVEDLKGVKEVKFINEAEAYRRMEKILGNEAQILAYLDDNPFSPFIEVRIDLQKMEYIVEKLVKIEGIEEIRNNKDVLKKLQNIVSMLETLGYLFLIIVTVCTLIVVYHIIRTGIYDNREQINTLRLLGAPESFISFPFIIEGLILTLTGGGFASLMLVISINYVYAIMSGPIPFIKLPSSGLLLSSLVPSIMIFCTAFGIIGSILGFRSAKSG